MKKAIFIVLLTLGTYAQASEWYETLRPGITRPEVLNMAGPPSGSSGNIDRYTRAQGYLELRYQTNILQTCTYYNTPDGAVAWGIYETFGDGLDQHQVKQRRNYLSARNFQWLPPFHGQSIYTHKYKGTCYQVDGAFIVIEPIITLGGGSGWFTNLTARVLLVKPDGSEECLYRAIDNWQNLKPPQLKERRLEERMKTLISMTNGIAGERILTALGEPDSHMGSGMDYRLFYLRNSLASVCASCSQPFIKFRRPGQDTVTFDQWKSITQNTPPNVQPSADSKR